MTAETIGSYHIEEVLGQGGMGIVYRARHSVSGAAVALKTVPRQTSRWLHGIRREIQALTRVRHPGVVRIIDHGVHQGRPWYAMDLLEGETLRQFGRQIWQPCHAYHGLSTSVGLTELLPLQESVVRLQPELEHLGTGTALDAHAARARASHSSVVGAAAGELPAVLRVMRRVCASLAYLHGEGFLNCDLKPENIVLVRGEPVIIDFGLSMHHPGGSGRESLEPLRSITGTVAYMSPEQIRGEFVDARSDLYAIGCMLYELVVGSPPFLGAPRSVSLQHLSAIPVAPSSLVREVPLQLERLILRLLEKEPSERGGYADEIAAELAELGADTAELSDYPASRSYLYRPRFVGRDVQLSELTAKRDQALRGAGSLVLLGGESGAGKTRLAMELTRTSRKAMRVMTSETAALTADGERASAPPPLHAVGALLQTIADECQTGGSDVTERVLGGRRSLLSTLEPLLAQVPARERLLPVFPLPPEAARERLFRALRETLAAFARERPLLWVIDDLGWLDEMSLAFLRSLSAEYLSRTPLLILCTYRSEADDRAPRALGAAPHVTRVHLDRLGQGPVGSMIQDMLALEEPSEELVAFVTREAEGNPFFVAEYLRGAVSERVLYRDEARRWRTRVHASDRSGRGLALLLPRSLRELLERRLEALSPAAQELTLAAAVLGRELPVDLLRSLSAQPETTFDAAIDELVCRQVLEQPNLGLLRFAHDKLRETAYSRAAPDRVVELHARAGAALERRESELDPLPASPCEPSGERAQLWVALGHHFALAHAAGPAIRYLRLAADHARASSAHDQAIQLYRRALEQTRTHEGNAPPARETRRELLEALGDTLALCARRVEARQSYGDALAEGGQYELVSRARLERKVGKTWETEHQHEKALRMYDRAQARLTDLTDPEQRNEWIQIGLDRSMTFYWLGRVADMQTAIAALQPVIETHATPAQRVRFFTGVLQHSLRRDRYLVDEQSLGYARAALDACGSGSVELPMASFMLGFALLFHGSLEAAAQQLERALALAREAGDLAQEARCLTYLALTARRRAQAEVARRFAEAALNAANSSGMRDYIAAGQATFAWLALRAGDYVETERRARAALEIWDQLALACPLRWTALLPLIELTIRASALDQAAPLVEALLDDSQQRLPEPAADSLRRFLRNGAARELESAERALNEAVRELAQANFA